MHCVGVGGTVMPTLNWGLIEFCMVCLMTRHITVCYWHVAFIVKLIKKIFILYNRKLNIASLSC